MNKNEALNQRKKLFKVGNEMRAVKGSFKKMKVTVVRRLKRKTKE